MTQHFGVFDAETGALLSAFSTNDLQQVSIQSQANREIVLEGDFTVGVWNLGADGHPECIQLAPIITADMIKLAARKRIDATEWMLSRHDRQKALGAPTSITDADALSIMAEHEAIRAASNRLEQMNPIPADFWQDLYWSAQ